MCVFFADMVMDDEISIVVKTKATTRGEEEQFVLKFQKTDTMNDVRVAIFNYCHGKDANPSTFTQDLMANTSMNVVIGKKKVGTTTPKKEAGDSVVDLEAWAKEFNVPLDGDWYLLLPMTVDLGGGT